MNDEGNGLNNLAMSNEVVHIWINLIRLNIIP